MNTTFDLTVRKEDLTNLYSDQTSFKLFSKEYAGRLFFIAVAFILGMITFIATFYSSNYVFYALLFAAGIVYCSYEIWKSYSTKMKKKASVEAWAEEVLKFQKHTLSINETAIVYQRDQEVFTYPFESIHVHHAPHYLQVLVNDGSELLIPKKAFSEEAYDRFEQRVNDIQAQQIA